MNGATHSRKDSEEAKVGSGLAKMMTKHAVQLASSLELAPRHGIFAIFKMY